MTSNSVLLIGYIGLLIEKTLSSGSIMVKLRVSTSRSWKDRNGKTQYSTTWHDVIAWDQTAAYAQRSFVKGSRVLVEGVLCYRTYPDHHGHTRYITEIKATHLENLDR